MAQQEYFGVFLPGGEGEAVAVFRDADAAQTFRKATYGADTGAVAPVQATVETNPDVDALLTPQEATAVAPAPADPDAALKEQIRADLIAQERRDRLTKEIKAELQRESRASHGE
jgi:hypothetical protein